MKTPRRFPIWVILLLTTLFSAHHIVQAATVSGRLLDALGFGFPNQSIALSAEGGGIFSAMTDAEGRFAFAVTPGNYSLSAWGDSFTRVNAPASYYIASSVFALSVDRTIDMRLPAKRVSVHVEDQSHNPLAAVQIAASGPLWTVGYDLGSGLTGGGRSLYYLNWGTSTPTTDQDGNATLWLFPSPPGSPYTLTVKPPADSGFAATTASVEVTADAEVNITLASPVNLSGRLLDALGFGFPNQSIALSAEGGGIFSAMTDAEGRFAFAVTPGNYSLSAWGDSFTRVNAPASYYIASSVFALSVDRTIDMRLPAKRVSVHVEDQSHNPLAAVQIAASGPLWTVGYDLGSGLTGGGRSLYYLNWGTSTPTTDQDGNATLWLFPSPPGSPYTLTVKPPADSGFAATTASVEVNDDMTLTVILEFVHQPPVTTATVSGSQNGQGAYLDSATITLSATAVSGFSVAATYYTIDGSQAVTYVGPFAITAVGDHAVVFWSIDNAGVYETPKLLTLTVAGGAIVISSLSPSYVQAGGGDFTLTVLGSGFPGGAQVLWNGSARATVRISETELHATILAADIATSEPITVASVQVLNPPDKYSNPAAFTIVCNAVEQFETKLANPNETVVVSAAPSEAGKAGVQATFTTSLDGGSRSVTAGTYSSNPIAGTFFDVGGGFVDLQVAGAVSGDLLTANFYYPSTVTGVIEDNLVLMHFDGSAWVPTLSSGGVAPVKDTTDNSDGTVSGGRFAVVFDDTSVPKVTELSGTVFAATVRGSRTIALDVLAQLLELRAGVTDRQDGHKLDQAIERFIDANDPAHWMDDSHLQPKKGEQVFQRNKEGVQKLEELARQNSALAPILLAFIADEVLSARILVEVILPDATGKDLDHALKELARGDAEVARGKPSEAIEHYKNAWKAVVR